ncbi:uncharacterized protein LOC117174403 [Belonocnema kinseyi]|uniref:uncharacterized protein LOC117174403 n=1 Tax=Belonocnema kinseyi TaxID=2817044 RepID=UPI00143D0110|nr:uncharacterized protein LOC117174403 [Belonocnema kinseyi]
MRYISIIIGLVSLSLAQDANECDKNWHNLETEESSKLSCGPVFQNRCHCERACFEREHKYIVNCTNSEFLNTEPLSHLPNKTQVLIFTGNYLDSLPSNIFGTLDAFPDLQVIDMSNNHIKEIRGKSYHHVKNVRRLILDFNQISLDPTRSHPRLFSNFISLEELHLTDAFEDSPNPRDMAATLHDIFVNSDLTKLIKLHLEQNEISEFRDSNVFCDLPNLLDLHLGDNSLTALHFNLSCLHNLRFLDLQRNKFTKVMERDLRTLDTFAKHNQSVMVDFSLNPFECSCRLNPFIKWMDRTKIIVRNKEHLMCTEGDKKVGFHETKDCPQILKAVRDSGTTVLLCLLSLLLISLICGFIYIQRAELKKKLQSVNKRVRYTSIATGENREELKKLVSKMSIFRRLRLDEVITSLPELGPTMPEGGYSWIVLFGILIVQMTVPSVLSMYGIVLGHLVSDNRRLDFDVWNEKITVTPILMTAFWSLADPWTKTIVNLASVPRVMTLIGIALLSTGVLASGYLATGGVGAYLANFSAGAIMGIGASFVMIQSEKVLRQHFRMKLPFARILMNLAFSTGIVFAPLVALALFTRLGIQGGLMAMVVLFLPTAIVTTILRSPGKEISSPYTLLFNEDEAESSLSMVEGSNSYSRNQAGSDARNTGLNPSPVDEINEINEPQGVFAEGSRAYSYEDPENTTTKLFVSPTNFQVLFKFGTVVVTCIGTRAGMMLFWLLLPPLIVIKVPSTNLLDGVILSMIGGIGTLVASIISYWNPNTARLRSLIFGFSNWIGSFVLLGLCYGDFYSFFIILALLGGMSVGGLLVSQEFVIRDSLGSHVASKSRAALTTCVGIAILLLSFIENMFLCLRIVGVIQFFGGSYWILSPLFGALKARWCR